MRFDPSRHYIIARDRETGEHVHVPLPDLDVALDAIPARDDSGALAELQHQINAVRDAPRDGARMASLEAEVAALKAAVAGMLDAIKAADQRGAA